jgi:hypothetical protein
MSSVFWLAVAAVPLRLCMYAFAVPHAATHRFLVEAFLLFPCAQSRNSGMTTAGGEGVLQTDVLKRTTVAPIPRV